MSDELEARLADIGPIVEKVRPILAGVDPSIQGAVLADLLGIWLAGHVVPGDRDETSAMRAVSALDPAWSAGVSNL